MLIVLIDNSKSSSAARITGATETIAELPQIDVPAPTRSDVFVDAPSRCPTTIATPVPTAMAVSTTAR